MHLSSAVNIVTRRRRVNCRRSPALPALQVVLVAAALAAQLPTLADAADSVWSSPFQSRYSSPGHLFGGSSSGVGRGGGQSLMAVNSLRRGRLHTAALMRKLGDDFNPRLMSVEKPPENLTEIDLVSESSFNVELYNELLQLVDFTLKDETTGRAVPLKRSARKYVEKWLLSRSSCRVRPAWTDLGSMFWPRWVRRGSCAGSDDDVVATAADIRHRPQSRRRSASPSASCSWPPGMRCVPEASHTIRLLYWRCTRRRRRADDDSGRRGGRRSGQRRKATRRRRRRERDRSQRRHVQDTTDNDVDDGGGGGGSGGRTSTWRCRWKKVPYAVTTACFCSC